MGAYSTYIFYALIFIVVVLLVEAIFFYVRNHMPSSKAANRRIKLIETSGDEAIGLTLLKEQARKRSNIGIIEKINHLLWAADLRISAGFFLILCVIIFFLVLAITTLANLGLLKSLLLALNFGVLVPVIFVRRKASKRRKLFSEQLVPAIDLVSRGLEAGHPAAVALEIVAKEMPDPIGSEFGIAIDEINFGLDRNVALSNMAKRFPVGDLKFFVSALEIQRETGGNLVEVLNNLTEVMRARAGMEKKIKAMSAEGKFTMRIVGVLPGIVAFIIVLMIPDYYSQHYDKPVFMLAMLIPAIFYTVGMLWIRRMINIRI